MPQHVAPPIPHLLALAGLIGLACASQTTDAYSAPSLDDACHEITLAGCFEDGNAVCCTTIAIRYEYEMLDARKHGDRKAFAYNREMLASLLDHACELGSDPGCEQLERLDVAQSQD